MSCLCLLVVANYLQANHIIIQQVQTSSSPPGLAASTHFKFSFSLAHGRDCSKVRTLGTKHASRGGIRGLNSDWLQVSIWNKMNIQLIVEYVLKTQRVVGLLLQAKGKDKNLKIVQTWSCLYLTKHNYSQRRHAEVTLLFIKRERKKPFETRNLCRKVHACTETFDIRLQAEPLPSSKMAMWLDRIF